jgi:hypothetical protein
MNPPFAITETEKVAYAIRRLKNTPSALLYIDSGQDHTWDAATICGIPVFHIRNLYPNHDYDCQWLALYNDDSDNDGYRFPKLYDEAP